MRSLPAVDAHAHIRADLDPREIEQLDGFVMAATRSLDEAAIAVARSDERVVWGVGCHPGLVGVQRAFDLDRFRGLIERTPVVSEVGLDGSSRVPPALQRETFSSILEALQEQPRLVSVHSYNATTEVLDVIESHQRPGTILHWWLGSPADTQRAVDLGCYFSINSSAGALALLDTVPPDRVLPETDHPFGDRRSRAAARPGNVADVETRFARRIGTDLTATRLQVWGNLFALARATDTVGLFPRAAQRQFAAL